MTEQQQDSETTIGRGAEGVKDISVPPVVFIGGFGPLDDWL